MGKIDPRRAVGEEAGQEGGRGRGSRDPRGTARRAPQTPAVVVVGGAGGPDRARDQTSRAGPLAARGPGPGRALRLREAELAWLIDVLDGHELPGVEDRRREMLANEAEPVLAARRLCARNCGRTCYGASVATWRLGHVDLPCSVREGLDARKLWPQLLKVFHRDHALQHDRFVGTPTPRPCQVPRHPGWRCGCKW